MSLVYAKLINFFPSLLTVELLLCCTGNKLLCSYIILLLAEFSTLVFEAVQWMDGKAYSAD
jgi:hypothetical protein